jgi:3-polyprenyl-4-hydroxybenzoate decarboxylase
MWRQISKMNLDYNPLTQIIDKNEQGEWFVRDKPIEELFEVLANHFDSVLTSHMDSIAQTKRYDNRITCALRAGYPGTFQEEGKVFAQWMDTCNVIAYQMMEDVIKGQRDYPKTDEEFLSEFPSIKWPN